MKTVKRKVFIISLSLLLLLLLTNCNRLELKRDDKLGDNKSKSENVSTNEIENKELGTKMEPDGVLVVVHSDEWIFLDGEAIIDGEQKKMECDLDGDGNFEYFLISRDSPNGTKVLAVAQQLGLNLAYDINLSNAFDEFGHPKENYGIQVTCYDLDKDGIKEIIVSVGNQSYEMESIIYRYTKSIDNPFELVAYIDGQEKMYIKEDGAIIAPYGSQGLFEEYRYLNKNL